jgi:fumarylacetoacetase
MAAGPARWAEVRGVLSGLLSDERYREVAEPSLLPIDTVRLHLPFAVADYVDFYSSVEHATNLGRIFRPDSEPLLPNWRHLPVGYHGRSGTIVPSGTPIRRPHGQQRGAEGPTFGPTTRLDIELEVGFVVGVPSEMGGPVPIDAAGDHLFGLVLVNDWSARDIQAWEYVPLGPFLGKSFATSISPWVTPLAALEPARIPGRSQHPAPLAYLHTDQDWGFDVDLEVWLTTETMRKEHIDPVQIAATNFRDMYWTPAQQLAHLTVNGASLRTGDVFASGTVSGAEPGSYGSLIELTWNGESPLALPDGTRRAFLEDGDEIVLRGSAPGEQERITLGEVSGTLVG